MQHMQARLETFFVQRAYKIIFEFTYMLKKSLTDFYVLNVRNVYKYTSENSNAFCPFLAANYFEFVSFFNILYTLSCRMPNDWMSVYGVVLYTKQVENDSNEFRCVNANKVKRRVHVYLVFPAQYVCDFYLFFFFV